MRENRYRSHFIGLLVLFCVLLSATPAESHTLRPPQRGSGVAGSDSLEFAAFAEELQTIFSKEKIASILSKLPPTSKIYGYDYGDISGDDGMDLVLSTRRSDAPPRVLDIHVFVNEGASFDLVRSLQRKYMLEPIEVGFSIEQGVCYITEKTGEYDWRITGYSMDRGLFRRVSEWTTRRMVSGGSSTSVGHERSLDLLTNEEWERFTGANSGKVYLEQKYQALPVYPLGLELPEDIPEWVGDSSGLAVASGGSSWYGADDSHFFLSARYDSSDVYFQLRVHDDRLLAHRNLDSADHFALYFDIGGKPKLRPDGSRQRYAAQSTFALLLRMGEGTGEGSVVELRGEGKADSLLRGVEVSRQAVEGSYNTWRFGMRIPRSLLLRNARTHSIGFAAVYHDVDHAQRRDWYTVLATAREFESDRPESWGRLRLVADPEEEFERLDLRTRTLARALRRAGLLP